MPSLALAGLGTAELLIILAIVLLLFGATKLPKLARSMGQSVHAFKSGLQDGAAEEPSTDEAATPPAPPAASHASRN